jgi:hypothetical protein
MPSSMQCLTASRHGSFAAALAMASLVVVTLAPRSAHAQTVLYKVLVPASAVTRSADEAKKDTSVVCKVTAKDYAATKDTNARDSLLVQIRNDRDQIIAAPRGISFGIAGVTPITVDSGHTAPLKAPMKEKTWSGAQLAVTRAADQVFICTALIKRDSEPDDSTRHPFRAGVGASFTPLSGVSKVDLYYDVTIFLPDAFRTLTGRGARWGIDAGLTNGRFSGTTDTLPERPAVAAVARPGSTPGKTDSVLYIRQGVTRTISRGNDLLTLYLAPTFRLSPGLFWAAHAEATKRDLSTTIQLKATAPDSALFPGTTLPDSVRLRPRVLPVGTTVPPLVDSARTFRNTQYDAFFGTGPLVVVERSKVEFRTKLMFGVGSYGPVTTGSYVASFRVTDFAHSFKLGGEVRGELTNTNPSIIVFLAKDYDIKHLAEFIFGSSSGDSAGK